MGSHLSWSSMIYICISTMLYIFTIYISWSLWVTVNLLLPILKGTEPLFGLIIFYLELGDTPYRFLKAYFTFQSFSLLDDDDDWLWATDSHRWSSSDGSPKFEIPPSEKDQKKVDSNPGPLASKWNEQMSDDLSVTPRCFGSFLPFFVSVFVLNFPRFCFLFRNEFSFLIYVFSLFFLSFLPFNLCLRSLFLILISFVIFTHFCAI